MRIKRAGIITWVILAALVIYGLTNLVVLRAKTSEAEAQRDALNQQMLEMSSANEKMSRALENSEDDAVMEDIARENGYVYDDEEVYITE